MPDDVGRGRRGERERRSGARHCRALGESSAAGLEKAGWRGIGWGRGSTHSQGKGMTTRQAQHSSLPCRLIPHSEPWTGRYLPCDQEPRPRAAASHWLSPLSPEEGTQYNSFREGKCAKACAHRPIWVSAPGAAAPCPHIKQSKTGAAQPLPAFSQAPAALPTGGRCRPQHPWGSSSLPPYQEGEKGGTGECS